MVSNATLTPVSASISTPVLPTVSAVTVQLIDDPAASWLNSTLTRVSAIGWHSGISSAVRLVAWIAAMRAMPSTSPLAASPPRMRSRVSGNMLIRPLATATRRVSSLPATSTMTARPRSSKWVNSLMLRNLVGNLHILNEMPTFSPDRPMGRPLMLRALLALALVSQPVAASDLPDLGEVSRQYFSDQEEQAIGRAIMRDVYVDPRYLDDPEIEAYLNQLGYKLVSVSTRNQREFTFFVVSDPTINAFAMPGGNIGVHTGLLLAAQSESELASVVAHEIAHVTQDHIARMVAAQSQSQWPTMAALALALLAARSNPNVASAAIASTQAYSIQNQLNYSRDYEREADRLGYDMLTRAGFDPHAMSEFFERLQRANRFYDTSAPAYLRTHPLTTDRIADMEARSESAPYRQVPDSLDFQLVRARLRAQEGSPVDAVIAARSILKDKRYSNETAVHYDLISALLRARQFKEAEAEVQKLPSGKNTDPMILQLAAYTALSAGNLKLALQR